MNRYTLTLGALAAILTAACSGSGGSEPIPDEPKVPTAPHAGSTTSPPAATPSGGATATEPAKDPDEDTAGAAGEDGETGRIASGPHCCYQGKYFSCPDETACFGGFDVDACLAACGKGVDTCFDKCFAQLDEAAAPKGCRSDVKPPAGVDCATGNINL